jgi:hypothetical protein
MDPEERRPEHIMVRRAVAGGALAAPLAFALGGALAGWEGGLSALIAVVVVVVNFAAHGLSLAWAAGISIPALQAVALGGFVVRMGIIVGLLFALDQLSFFSPVIFGLTAVASTLLLLGYEAKLALRGVGGSLEIPPEPAAAAASEQVRLREGTR